MHLRIRSDKIIARKCPSDFRPVVTPALVTDTSAFYNDFETSNVKGLYDIDKNEINRWAGRRDMSLL